MQKCDMLYYFFFDAAASFSFFSCAALSAMLFMIVSFPVDAALTL